MSATLRQGFLNYFSHTAFGKREWKRKYFVLEVSGLHYSDSKVGLHVCVVSAGVVMVTMMGFQHTFHQLLIPTLE